MSLSAVEGYDRLSLKQMAKGNQHGIKDFSSRCGPILMKVEEGMEGGRVEQAQKNGMVWG